MIQRIKDRIIESLGGYTEEEYSRRLDGLGWRIAALDYELKNEKARRMQESKTFRVEASMLPMYSGVPTEVIERDMTAKLMEGIKPFIRWSTKDGAYFGSVLKIAEITVVTEGDHE